MKRASTLLSSALLVLTASFCTLGTILSAYQISYGIVLLLLAALIILSLIVTALAHFWRYKGILGFAPALVIFVMLSGESITRGYKFMVFCISEQFNKWLPVPVFFNGAAAAELDVLLFFVAVGAILVALLSIAVVIRRSAPFAFCSTFPIAMISLILVDYPPNAWYLAGLLAVYLIMMIGSAVHPEEPRSRSRTFLPALGLSLALLGVTYLVALPANHERGKLITYLDNAIEGVVIQGKDYGLGWPAGVEMNWRFNTSNVEISEAGERKLTGTKILEIKSDTAGTFYLRGYAMSYFDGHAWKENVNNLPISGEELIKSVPTSLIGSYMYFDSEAYSEFGLKHSRMTITNVNDSSNLSYYPYYYGGKSSELSFAGLGEEAEYEMSFSISQVITSEYDFSFFHLEGSLPAFGRRVGADESPLYDLDEYNAQVQETYTQLDAGTAAALYELALASGINPNSDRETIANQVAACISTSARYTLSPAAIPDNEDFALYFLQESKEGYCIHFATAAALMLRALDIPSRFVSGFMVTVSEADVGKTVDVTDRQAHAWVEVYYENIGWVPLEATASSSGSGTYTPSNPYEGGASPSPSPEVTPPPSQNPQTNEPGGDGKDGSAGISSALLWVVLAIAFILLAMVGLILRRRIAALSRARKFSQKDSNAAAISAWKYIMRLSGKNASPPEEIETLALKARFSQHQLSQSERSAIVDHANTLAEATDRDSGRLQRLWLRYIRGLY